MKLYYTKGVCSLAVRILIHELQLSSLYEAVDLKTKKTETGEDFLTINPKGSVPAIKLDSGEVLTENSVILQYLADVSHASHLLAPVGDMKRYRVLEWLNFISTDLHRYAASLFLPKFSKELKDSFFKPILSNKLSFVNDQLKDNKFLMGDHIALCDYYLVVVLTWLKKIDVDIKQWPNLSSYFDHMKNQLSVHDALTEEGIVDL